MHPFILFALVEIVIEPVHLLVYRPCHLAGYAQTKCMVNTVVFEQHPERKDLKQHKCYERKITADKKKNIAHERRAALAFRITLYAFDCNYSLRFRAYTFDWFISLQKDNGRNSLGPVLYHELRSSGDHRQHAPEA